MLINVSDGSQVIDVDGLRMFVKELESLPCTLPALEPLRVRGTVMCGMGGVGVGVGGQWWGEMGGQW